MKRNLLFSGILAIAVLTGCTKSIQEQTVSADNAMATASADPRNEEIALDEYVPNEVLVKFKSGTATASKSQAFAKIGGKVAERILTKAMQHVGDNEGVYRVQTSQGVLEAITHMKEIPGVEYAEPNYIYHHTDASNDAYYTNGSLWGMYGNGTSPVNQFGSQAGEAWNAGFTGAGTNAPVYIGIIDEGAMFSHADLGNFGNPNETADGLDNDGNGYIDDVTGWDFDGNNNTTYDGTQDDHGTHVAGTIGGKGGNGIGVAGVNWGVKLISAKFLGASGGTTANAISAVDYITALKNKGVNIVATNNSWGGGGYSQGLYEAILRANTANILFVAAAGNGNQGGKGINIDSKPSYPASYNASNIISVAAITSSGALASFSNYGLNSVDLGAPGYGIYSTVPTGYASYNGTSMATPHVTGAVSLYAYYYPGTSAAAIKSAILSAATSTSSLAGKTVTGGRLNVGNLFGTP